MLTVRRYLIPTMGVKIKEYPSASQNKRPPLREALINTDSLRPPEGAVTGITDHRGEPCRRQDRARLGRP
jgi:hypothetical protein